MTTTFPQGTTRIPRRFGIFPRLGAVTCKGHRSLKGGLSRPHVILKFRCPRSLDYKAYHGLQAKCAF